MYVPPRTVVAVAFLFRLLLLHRLLRTSIRLRLHQMYLPFIGGVALALGEEGG